MFLSFSLEFVNKYTMSNWVLSRIKSLVTIYFKVFCFFFSCPELKLILFFYAFHTPVCPRNKIQKTIAGPQTLMNDLFQWAYLVFSNRDMARKS